MKKTRSKPAPQAAATNEMRGLYQRGRVWWYRWTQNGERRFESTHTENYAEAVAIAERIKACPAFASGDRIIDELTRFLAAKKATEIYGPHSAEWAASPIRQLATLLNNKAVEQS